MTALDPKVAFRDRKGEGGRLWDNKLHILFDFQRLLKKGPSIMQCNGRSR
jgi:hypothetical protein